MPARAVVLMRGLFARAPNKGLSTWHGGNCNISLKLDIKSRECHNAGRSWAPRQAEGSRERRARHASVVGGRPPRPRGVPRPGWPASAEWGSRLGAPSVWRIQCACGAAGRVCAAQYPATTTVPSLTPPAIFPSCGPPASLRPRSFQYLLTMLLTKAESGVALLPPPSTDPQRAPTRWARPGVFRSVVLVLLAGAFVLAYRLPFFATQGLWTASIAGTVHIQASHDPSLPISAAVRTPLAHAPTGSTKTPASIHTAPTAPARTTQTERTGLLFQALAGGKPVPSDWAEWLIPQTRPAQIEALERLVQLGRTTPIDARLVCPRPVSASIQHPS